MDSTEKLLKALTEARGIAGHEEEVREIFKTRMQGLGKISFDGLGSVICEQKGDAEHPRIMVTAHMDEPGFLVRAITPSGFLNLALVGGWRSSVLPAQRFMVQTRSGDVPCVMCSEAPHAASPEERIRAPKLDELYADIGVASEKEVLGLGVRVGDPVVPAAPFEIMREPGTYLAKAWDNRGGCALLIDLLNHFKDQPHPNTLIGVATVQEEVIDIERGAQTSVRAVEPDLGIILECGGADDTSETRHSAIRLNKGPVLVTADISMTANPRLKDLVVDLAAGAGIPLQLAVTMKGRTDGGPVHLHRGGIPVIVIIVPARYIHCHSGIMKRADYDRTLKLLALLISRLDHKTVEGLTQW